MAANQILKLITEGNNVIFRIGANKELVLKRQPTGFEVDFPDGPKTYLLLDAAKAFEDIRTYLINDC